MKGNVGVVVPIPNATVNDKGQPIIEKVMTEVRILESGAAFGELALMDSKPRAATIVCKEECYFAVLDKKPFKEILGIEKPNLRLNI